jgi:subtilisin family serine protease
VRSISLASLALAGLMTLALIEEGSAARGFGGGMRSFGGMRATGTRSTRMQTTGNMRAHRNVGRYSGRISRNRGGDGRYPGKVGRYPGNIDRNPGKVVSHDPGRWPRRPGHPIWRYPGYPVVNPTIPLTPGSGTTTANGVPPTINQVTTPPNTQGSNQSQSAQRGGFNPPPPGETRFVRNEVLLNVSSTITTPAFDAIAQRNRLTRLELREFSITGRRIARVRINDGRAVANVIRSLQAEAGIAGAHPNYLFALDQGSGPADPTQYAYAKLHLSQAHALAKGDRIRVAVVDSMIDASHPDLGGAVAAPFDATGAAAQPHFHGTGVAGVIAAHGKLTGAAPSVQILGITAFVSKESRGTGMDILKALDWAGTSKADIVNMSFTGPTDAEQHIMLAALQQKGIVLIAAAGNDGPKAPPAYPAAFTEVIAVTATDSDDNLYADANRGAHIAVAAPGVAILVAAPGGSYKMRTGTSFAAPQVSGIAALLLERNRKLDPIAIRSILTTTARDLGPPGPDDQFGSGLVDAMRAVESAG